MAQRAAELEDKASLVASAGAVSSAFCLRAYCKRPQDHEPEKKKSKPKMRRTAVTETATLSKGNSEAALECAGGLGGRQARAQARARSVQRNFSAEWVTAGLLKEGTLFERKKRLTFRPSKIHGWGLFAQEPVSKDEMVIEYVGELIGNALADVREARYEAVGIGSSYLFRVDAEFVVDATKKGNIARFMNHSCDPNCTAKVVEYQGGKKIAVFADRSIGIGEEITYDYKFPYEEDKIPCHCGSDMCKKYLN